MTKTTKRASKTISYNEHLFTILKTPSKAVAYLNAASVDEDPRVFLVALKEVAESHRE